MKRDNGTWRICIERNAHTTEVGLDYGNDNLDDAHV